MILKYKDINPDRFEHGNRHCPVCGEYIQKGSWIHECDAKVLKNIDRGRKAAETRLENDGYYAQERTLDDRFAEIEDMLDMDYIDLDEDGFN